MPKNHKNDEIFWAKGKLKMPENKKRITVYIDHDILEWLKKPGPGYQTRLNAILRQYMLAKTDAKT